MPNEIKTRMAEDTRKLLVHGGGIFCAGALAALLASTILGGMGPQGPHTNSGWLALMIAMGCLPFGTILLLLGLAKWIGHRKQ